jgi:hypothetical protein
MSDPVAPVLSEPDADGRRTATWAFPVHTVKGGDEAWVYHERVDLDCSAFTHVTEVESFIGLERGDEVEAAVDLTSTGGYSLYTRSEHKEIPGDYDAWHSQPVSYHLGNPLTLELTCRVTGNNPQGKLIAGVQFELRLKVR